MGVECEMSSTTRVKLDLKLLQGTSGDLWGQRFTEQLLPSDCEQILFYDVQSKPEIAHILTGGLDSFMLSYRGTGIK